MVDSGSARTEDGGTARRGRAGPGLAVLGGSFDPPHLSHARLLLAARQGLPVGQLLVIPAGDHPHKQDTGMSPATHRLAMCRLAFGRLRDVAVDDRELHRSGRSYTVDTLAELAAEHPGRPLYFLIGSDNLLLLPTWRDHHRVLALATVVTYPRAGHPIDEGLLRQLDLTGDELSRLLANVLNLTADDVAATTIRAQFRRGQGDRAAVEPVVAAYIAEHGLYRA